MNLAACLDQCSLGLLRQIAAAHGVRLEEPPARRELIEALLQRLGAPGYLARYIEQLSDNERWILASVAGAGGPLRGYVLERRLRQHDLTASETDLRDQLDALVQKGLLYRSFLAVGPERGEVFVLPEELRSALPTQAERTEFQLRPAPAPREVRRASPLFSLFALASFIRRWRQHEGRGGAREGQLAALAAETAELAVELPGRAPRERWTLLAHLGLQLGLLTREERGLRTSDRFEGWLARAAEAERQLWESYLAAESWNDLERAGAGGQRFVGRTATPSAARRRVVNLLRALPQDGWVLTRDVQRLVRECAPDFLREGFDNPSSRLVDLSSGEVLGGAMSWERVEGPLVSYLLTGPLFWLGLVEWGRVGDEWDRLRLTVRARGWLEEAALALEPAPAPCSVDDDRRLVAPEDTDLSLLWQLEPYLALERRGPPSVYRLTRGSLLRGLEVGGSIDELRALLARATGEALPLAWSVALERWGARAGRFKIQPGVLLLAEREQELDAVLGSPALAAYVRERLGPRAALLMPTQAMEAAEALERLGHLPEVDAALRLMAGRRAYAALVDQQVLETQLLCLRLLRLLRPSLLEELPQARSLIPRLEDAVGAISAQKLARKARAMAREIRDGWRGASHEREQP